MPFGTVERFLTALSPHDRERVHDMPHAEQERLAAAWETELQQDRDLDTLSELSPPAAEHEAASRVVKGLFA